MIAYFPEIYPDELVYSVFARYYLHSGLLRYRSVAEQLLLRPRERPETEFVNELSPEAVEAIGRNGSIEKYLVQHTMLEYYLPFMDREARKRAYRAVVRMEGNYYRSFLFTKRKNSERRQLRYCPMCVKSDRAGYGEAYWHRKHQIQGIDVCSKHGCKLAAGGIVMGKQAAPDFVALEQIQPVTDVIGDDRRKQEFAIYVCALLDREPDLETEVQVGQYLDWRLKGTKYTSRRGRQRNLALLFGDFMKFKEENGMGDSGITQMWQIGKLLEGYRKNPIEICQLAYFLGVSTDELASPNITGEMPESAFDELVTGYMKEGLSIYRVSRQLGVSSATVRSVCKRMGVQSVYAKEKSPRQREQFEEKLRQERDFWIKIKQTYPDRSYTGLCKDEAIRSHLQWLRRNDPEWTERHWMNGRAGKKGIDWGALDEATLPMVKEAIRELRGDGNRRPQRITVNAVKKKLNLPEKQLERYLVKCRAEVERCSESQTVYWAKELEWAIGKLLRDGVEISYKQIRNLTNMRRSYIDEAIPLLPEGEIKEIVLRIQSRTENVLL